MLRVYTLTLNPALDLSGHVPNIIPNEKNYVIRERRDPGGNGINAARIVHRFGVKTRALGFAGGATGVELIEKIRAEGVPAEFIRISDRTRVNVTITNDSDHQQTRLTFRGPKIRAAEIQALFQKLKEMNSPGILVIGGSLPEGCPENLYEGICGIVNPSRMGIMIDAPPRYLRWMIRSRKRSRPGFMPLLLMKPNQTELEELMERKFGDDLGIARAAISLAEQSALVCVSLAERGAILASGGRAWFAKAPRVKARGAVGAGDSMVGAIAAKLLCAGLTTHARILRLFEHSTSEEIPQELGDALQWGVAAGAATAEAEGTRLASFSEIKKLRKRVRLGKDCFAQRSSNPLSSCSAPQ